MIDKIKYKLYDTIGRRLILHVLKKEDRKRPFNERPVEYAFAMEWLSKECTGKILDVGTGKSSWPHLLRICGYDITAIDQIKKYWNGFFNRHFLVKQGDITNPSVNERFDFITCLSVLEHIPEHDEALNGMTSLLTNEGRIILTFPYNENIYHPNIYKEEKASYGKNAKYITQVYSREELDNWCKNNNLEIEDQRYYNCFTGEMWTFGERVVPPKDVDKNEMHHLTCIVLKRK